jgi:hypothetical protein
MAPGWGGIDRSRNVPLGRGGHEIELQVHAGHKALEVGPNAIWTTCLESVLRSELAEVPAARVKPLRDSFG